MIIVYSEIPLSKNSYHMETSQLICFANQLTGYYMIQGSTKRYFYTEYNFTILNLMAMTYLALEHEALDFFYHFPIFSKR